VVVDGGDDLGEARVPRPLAHSVDARVHAARARTHGGEAVGGRQAVVVVGVELEDGIGPGGRHQTHVALDVVGSEDPERVGQVDAVDFQLAQELDHGEDVVERVAHSVRPVLQVDVHRQALAAGVTDGLADPAPVPLGRHVELAATVALRSLDQEVEHAPARLDDPVDGRGAVAVAEDLDAGAQALLARPLGDQAGGLAFPLGDAAGRDLDAVDSHVLQQQPRQLQLFRRGVGHVRGLLSVTQGHVHHGDAIRIGTLHGGSQG
jgi:hypothetical protein